MVSSPFPSRIDPLSEAKKPAGWRQIALVPLAVVLYEVAHVWSVHRKAAAVAHARQLLDFERAVGIDWEHVIQHAALHSDVVRAVANGVYTWLYWPVLLGALILLWLRDRRRYVLLRDGMVSAGVVGILLFLLYPVAPPRMLPDFVNTIAAGSVERAVVHGVVADPYAAFPSFHAGWFAIAAVMLAVSSRRAVVVILAATAAAAMAAAVIITGNHYVIDVVTGMGLSFAGMALSAWRHRERAPFGMALAGGVAVFDAGSVPEAARPEAQARR